MNTNRPVKILAYFPSLMVPLREEIYQGKSPKERMYGFYELEQKENYAITYADYRHKGVVSRLLKPFKDRGLNLIHPRAILDISKSDLVVIKDNFSLSTNIVAWLFNKPVIYYDSMFPLPNSRLKRLFLKWSLAFSKKIIGYSPEQAKLYSKNFKVPLGKFETVEFALDPDFYVLSPAIEQSELILSVGRDPGRDFNTLAAAASTTQKPLHLVTLPYLLDGIDVDHLRIQTYQYLSYQQLFELYAQAKIVIVPLKEGLTYPSGIRAALEALTLKKPVIISATDYVKANIKESSVLKFTAPGDPEALANAILSFDSSHTDPDAYSQHLPSYPANIERVETIFQSVIS